MGKIGGTNGPKFYGFTVRMPKDKLERLEAFAEQENLHRSVYARKIILDFLRKKRLDKE